MFAFCYVKCAWSNKFYNTIQFFCESNRLFLTEEVFNVFRSARSSRFRRAASSSTSTATSNRTTNIGSASELWATFTGPKSAKELGFTSDPESSFSSWVRKHVVHSWAWSKILGEGKGKKIMGEGVKGFLQRECSLEEKFWWGWIYLKHNPPTPIPHGVFGHLCRLFFR